MEDQITNQIMGSQGAFSRATTLSAEQKKRKEIEEKVAHDKKTLRRQLGLFMTMSSVFCVACFIITMC